MKTKSNFTKPSKLCQATDILFQDEIKEYTEHLSRQLTDQECQEWAYYDETLGYIEEEIK